MRSTRFLLDGWLVDTQMDTVRRGTQLVKLEPRTMQVLAVLAARPGELVTLEALEQSVWPGVIVTTQSTYQAVAQLRRVFEDDARNPRIIATVPRKGYCLLGRVSPVDEHVLAVPLSPASPAPALVPAPAAVQTDGPATPAPVAPTASAVLTRRRALQGSAVGVVVAAAAGVWWRFDRAGASALRPAIAVLPFEDLSAEQSQAYLARALSEEVMLELGRSDSITVIARGSVASFQPDSDITRVREQTSIGFVVAGSVRRTVDRVRVTARLLDAQRSVQIWGDSFERPVSDMQRIPQDVARAVVASLQRELGDQFGLPAALPGTRNLSAYEYYLLGTQRRYGRTRLDLADAAAYFRKAIDIDPQFVAAYTGLGRCYLGEFYYAGRALDETRAAVLPLVSKALSLDPLNGGALALSGQLLHESGDSQQAERLMQKAVQSSPNDAEAWMGLGMAQHANAKVNSADATLQRAERVDPLNWVVLNRRGLVQIAMNDLTAAGNSFARGQTLAPNHPNPVWGFALIELARGNLRAAASYYGRALAIDASRSDLWRQKAMLHWELGEDEAARAALRPAIDSASSSAESAGARASLAFVNGQRSELAALAEVMANADPDSIFNLGDAATLLLVAGEVDVAHGLLERAAQLLPKADSMLDLWSLAWGMQLPGVALASTRRLRGDIAGREQSARQAQQYLDQAERNGVRSPGLRYARAALAALRGDADGAVAALRLAYSRGWRRARWLRVDPLFDTIRKTPQFQNLLSSLPALPVLPGLRKM